MKQFTVAILILLGGFAVSNKVPFRGLRRWRVPSRMRWTLWRGSLPKTLLPRLLPSL